MYITLKLAVQIQYSGLLTALLLTCLQTHNGQSDSILQTHSLHQDKFSRTIVADLKNWKRGRNYITVRLHGSFFLYHSTS